MKAFDNIEEILVGAVIALSFVFYVGWWVLLLIPLCAFLWWLGGAEGYSKAYRRMGVPVVLCSAIAISLRSWIPLASMPAFFGVLSIGYGIPWYDDPGSFLGRVVCRVFRLDPVTYGYDLWKADLIVRGIIGLLIGLSMGSLYFVAPFWKWFVMAIIVSVGYPAVVNVVE